MKGDVTSGILSRAVFSFCLLLILIFPSPTARVCHERLCLTPPMAAGDQRKLGSVRRNRPRRDLMLQDCSPAFLSEIPHPVT